jgi:hypothetical protein
MMHRKYIVMALILASLSSAQANLIANESFETQGGTAQEATNWTSWGGSRESWQAQAGTWSAAFHPNEASAGWFANTEAGAVSEGNAYVGGAWFYSDNNPSWGYTNAGSVIKIEWFDAGSNAVGTPAEAAFSAPGEIWQYNSVTGVAPAGVSFARLVGFAAGSGQASGSSGAGNMFMDNASLTQAIPEPATAGILGISLFSLCAIWRKRIVG